MRPRNDQKRMCDAGHGSPGRGGDLRARHGGIRG